MSEISGYIRPDGRVGIRNHVLVLPTVSCVNGVVRRIAEAVPGVASAVHPHGCGRGGPRDLEILFRILSGMIRHPNVGGVVLIGLGCEVSSIANLRPFIHKAEKPIEMFNVQTDGGSLETARKGIDAARRMLQDLQSQRRSPMTWEKVIVAMECGGSDALSGVTANVALGAISDWLVEKGATVIFGENTEMIGTAGALKRRAKNEQIAGQIERMIDRAEKLTRDVMGELAGLVISPGNMDGGISTIAEKSMGCVVKGGTTTIRQVVDYGEAPTERGLILQDGPGYDCDSMAGLAAGGAQLMFFSTGRGTPVGFPVMPVVKVASNTEVYQAMSDDIDVNAGVLTQGASLEALRDEMIQRMIRIINGEQTKAEINRMEVFSFMTVHPPF